MDLQGLLPVIPNLGQDPTCRQCRGHCGTATASAAQPASVMLMQLDAVIVFDHFPHVRAQALDFDAIQVINRLLEGSLPPSVASLDPQMPMAAAETASASLPSSSTAGLSVNGTLSGQRCLISCSAFHNFAMCYVLSNYRQY